MKTIKVNNINYAVIENVLYSLRTNDAWEALPLPLNEFYKGVLFCLENPPKLNHYYLVGFTHYPCGSCPNILDESEMNAEGMTTFLRSCLAYDVAEAITILCPNDKGLI